MRDNNLSQTTDSENFLNYVQKNYNTIREGLMKNKTYNEDVFHDTIIACTEAIKNSNKPINSYKDYIFLACKYNFYHLCKNEIKDNEKKIKYLEHKSIMEDEIYEEEDITIMENKNKNLKLIWQFICEDIENNTNFKKSEIDIYKFYMILKAQGKMKYTLMSKLLNISVGKISNIITKINGYVTNNKEILKYKENLTNGNNI